MTTFLVKKGSMPFFTNVQSRCRGAELWCGGEVSSSARGDDGRHAPREELGEAQMGPSVFPQSVQDAYDAEIIFVAVPFPAHKDVAKQFKQWNGKIVVDVTNAFHVAPEELEDRLSSEVISQAFVGARLVKAFNHLPAGQLGTNPSLDGQRQVVFVSSNDADASATVAAVATQLGFAPVELGRLDKGGVPFMF